MKITLPIILLLAGGLSVSLWKLKSTTAELDGLKQQLRGAQDSNGKLLADLRVKDTEVASAKAAQAAAEAVKKADDTAMNAGAAAKDGKGEKKNENPFGKLTKSLGKMLNDDGMKSMMSAQMKSMVTGQYRDLFDQLGLDEKARAEVEDLLVARLGAAQSLGLKALGGDKADMAKAAESLKTEQEAITAKLKSALGTEKYEMLDRFDDSQPERQSIAALKGTLQGKEGLALTAEQEQQLMTLMHSKRKNAKYDFNYGDQRSFDPKMMEAEAIEKYQKQSANTNEEILKESGTFLGEEQVKALKDHQDMMKRMEQMGLDMMKNLMGGEGEEK